MSHNHQKKIAVINDLSGFGRCSIAVALPLISHLGIQCCPLPTAIFSDHTGFDSFYVKDFTDSMAPYMAEWKKLDLEFEGILTGFLGSVRQIELVEQFLKEFTTQRTTVIVDPVRAITESSTLPIPRSSARHWAAGAVCGYSHAHLTRPVF